MIRLNPIQAGIAALNNQVHQMGGVKGTVWESYELVETQWQQAFPHPIKISNPGTNEDLYKPELNGIPLDKVANTTMETFYQGKAGAAASWAKRPGPAHSRDELPPLPLRRGAVRFQLGDGGCGRPSSPASQSKIAHIPHKK